MSTESEFEYELGEDVSDELRPVAKRRGIVISARLDPDDAQALMDLAASTGKSVSQLAREAIHAYVRQPSLFSAVEAGSIGVGGNAGHIVIRCADTAHTMSRGPFVKQIVQDLGSMRPPEWSALTAATG